MDAPPTDMAGTHITTMYNLRAKHKIILSKGTSSSLDKNELTLFSSLCFGGVSKDLSHFALGYRAEQVPRNELPRSNQAWVIRFEVFFLLFELEKNDNLNMIFYKTFKLKSN